MNESETLPWTDDEIVMHYNQAADKYKIVRILAELNNVSVARIRKVLGAAGIDAPSTRGRKKRSEPGTWYALVHGDQVYSIGQVCAMTGRSRSYFSHRIKRGEEVEAGGVVYRAVKVERRMM